MKVELVILIDVVALLIVAALVIRLRARRARQTAQGRVEDVVPGSVEVRRWSPA